jgi:hypothetical protein
MCRAAHNFRKLLSAGEINLLIQFFFLYRYTLSSVQCICLHFTCQTCAWRSVAPSQRIQLRVNSKQQAVNAAHGNNRHIWGKVTKQWHNNAKSKAVPVRVPVHVYVPVPVHVPIAIHISVPVRIPVTVHVPVPIRVLYLSLFVFLSLSASLLLFMSLSLLVSLYLFMSCPCCVRVSFPVQFSVSVRVTVPDRIPVPVPVPAMKAYRRSRIISPTAVPLAVEPRYPLKRLCESQSPSGQLEEGSNYLSLPELELQAVQPVAQSPSARILTKMHWVAES